MTEWNTLRARFPDDEIDEIERIKEQYGLSYNEIIRSGVKFYIGLTMAKEMIGETMKDNDITIGGKNLGDLVNKSQTSLPFVLEIYVFARKLLLDSKWIQIL